MATDLISMTNDALDLADRCARVALQQLDALASAADALEGAARAGVFTRQNKARLLETARLMRQHDETARPELIGLRSSITRMRTAAHS